MSAHAYSSGSRRHARHHVRESLAERTTTAEQGAGQFASTSRTSTSIKSADVFVLVPRQQKPGQALPPKTGRAVPTLTLLLVLGIHLVAAWQLANPPEPVLKKAEPLPMTVELYRPPVEPQQPEQPPEPEPVPEPEPEPVAEKPEPMVKEELPKPEPKPEPKPVQEKPEPEPVKPEPVRDVVDVPEPPPEPVLTKASADAGYLRNPAPRYPDFAQQQGWEGTVILNVHVLANGKAKAVQVQQSSGRKILDDAAVQAVKRWKFAPAMLGNTATDSWVEVPIDFRLSQ